MKPWYKNIYGFINKNRDDLSYLLFVGLFFSILVILINKCMDFTHMF